MSPGACCRLEATGFAEVYDYVLGIADRMAAGLPTEGEALDIQRIADATPPDIQQLDPMNCSAPCSTARQMPVGTKPS
jgi:hypothetical protein